LVTQIHTHWNFVCAELDRWKLLIGVINPSPSTRQWNWSEDGYIVKFMARRKRTKNTGKAYESKVSEAIRSLYPGGIVEDNIKLPGVITGTERQVDTLLDLNGVLTDFDAKDHKRKIDMDTIAAYKFKLDDEQIKNGVVVANSPYVKTAIKASEHMGVKLTHLINLSDKDIPFKIAQKTLVEDLYVKSLRFGVRHFSLDGGFSLDRDLAKAVLVNDDGSEEVNAYTVFQQLWNQGFLKVTRPGMWQYTLPNQKVIMADGSVKIIDEFNFMYEVTAEYKQGEWEIEEAEGLYDVKKGTFTSNKDLLSSKLSVDQVKDWPVITKEEADKRSFGMKLSVVSLLPDAPPSSASDIG
jgi:hypothetical protein